MKDEITECAKKNWKLVAGAVIAFFFLVFFREMFFIALLLGLSVVVSLLASKTKTKLIGVELVTFSTVLVGYTHGPVWGCIAGVTLESINALIISRWMRTYNVWVIPSFGLAGIAAGLNFGLPFATIGIIIAIGLHVIYSVLSILLHGHLHPKYIFYAIFNIVINILLFTGFGAIALGFLS
ncbi:MAG: hypothetical protein PHC66_05045 [Candidatus Nanoarchaeia archaeon]|nr:hypothetical protein [Candidatus Nanoarchaeia archaeon]MDD5238968.1 hypothetical protein [Candidatus Nanoarchaeia archaeon]